MARSLGSVGRGVAALVIATACVHGAPGAPVLSAQTPVAPTTRPADSTPPAPAGVAQAPAIDPNVPPADYVIGPDDILTIKYWRDDNMSADVVVRPDGRITLPLINEVQAAGLTPEQLRAAVVEAASKLIEGPTVNVIVKQINSRRIFITGEVAKPGPYALTGRMNVLQMLALAGGVSEYADKSNIGIFRTENGKQVRFRFNYNDVLEGKNLQQNIDLKPNDTIVVKD